MVKRLLYNIFLNIGIIVLCYSAFVGYNNQQYGIVVGALLAAAVLIYLKVKLIRSVRDVTKK